MPSLVTSDVTKSHLFPHVTVQAVICVNWCQVLALGVYLYSHLAVLEY